MLAMEHGMEGLAGDWLECGWMGEGDKVWRRMTGEVEGSIFGGVGNGSGSHGGLGGGVHGCGVLSLWSPFIWSFDIKLLLR
ncbi:hypothetical protein SLA2020_342200 [Shorea laevis]